MPKLSYFYAQNLKDHDVYSIRTRTLKEAKEERKDAEDRFGPIYRRYLEYRDAFDLLSSILNEGGEHTLIKEERLAKGEKEQEEPEDWEY